MTYELPDEVREAAAKAIFSWAWEDNRYASPEYVALVQKDGRTYVDRVLPVLAAHFERVGAIKMREAAARAANESGVQGLRARNGDSIPKRQGYAAGASEVVRAIRALPLPSQSTQRDTEEAAQ